MGGLKGTDHMRELGVDGRKIFKICIKEIVCADVDWIYLDQDRVQKEPR
jgi:hypothetical protein